MDVCRASSSEGPAWVLVLSRCSIVSGVLSDARGEHAISLRAGDGRLDLIVVTHCHPGFLSWATCDGRNALYRNEGGGNFTRVHEGVVATDNNKSTAVAWGDYDGTPPPTIFVLCPMVAAALRVCSYRQRSGGTGYVTVEASGAFCCERRTVERQRGSGGMDAVAGEP